MDHIWPFISILVEPDAAVFLWYRAGYPIWLTYVLLSLPTSFTISMAFFSAGWIKKSGKIRWGIDNIREKFRKIADKLASRFAFFEKLKKFHDRLVAKAAKTLRRGGLGIVFIASCIPFVPVIPTAAAAAAKLMEIKHGLLLILAGTAIRNALVVLGIYYGVPFFFPN